MSKLIGEEGAHNIGQTDASKGEYNPPHSTQDVFLSGFNPFQDTKAMVEENKSYNVGHVHATKQK